MLTTRMFFITTSLLLGSLLQQAQAGECRTTLARYAQFMFPQLLSALDRSCLTTLDAKEQLFVAGLTQHFLENCKVPTQHRLKLQKFLTSSSLVGAIGGQYGNKDLGAGLGDQTASGTVYAAGASVAKEMGCQDATRLTNGVLAYLDRTASGNGQGAKYVKGCVQYYGGQYSEQQCQCVADIGQSLYPNIHSLEFSRDSIASIIQRNPFVGLQIAGQCRIGNY